MAPSSNSRGTWMVSLIILKARLMPYTPSRTIEPRALPGYLQGISGVQVCSPPLFCHPSATPDVVSGDRLLAEQRFHQCPTTRKRISFAIPLSPSVCRPVLGPVGPVHRDYIILSCLTARSSTADKHQEHRRGQTPMHCVLPVSSTPSHLAGVCPQASSSVAGAASPKAKGPARPDKPQGSPQPRQGLSVSGL